MEPTATNPSELDAAYYLFVANGPAFLMRKLKGLPLTRSFVISKTPQDLAKEIEQLVAVVPESLTEQAQIYARIAALLSFEKTQVFAAVSGMNWSNLRWGEELRRRFDVDSSNLIMVFPTVGRTDTRPITAYPMEESTLIVQPRFTQRNGGNDD